MHPHVALIGIARLSDGQQQFSFKILAFFQQLESALATSEADFGNVAEIAGLCRTLILPRHLFQQFPSTAATRRLLCKASGRGGNTDKMPRFAPLALLCLRGAAFPCFLVTLFFTVATPARIIVCGR